MTDRNWYDSKRRPSSDSKSQHHLHNSFSENSFADNCDRGHRNHVDDRNNRDYKKDRYASSNESHQRKHSSDNKDRYDSSYESHQRKHSSDNRHDIRRSGHHRERGDKYSSRSRYDEDERYSPRHHKSHHKNDWKSHEHSSGSSYGSPYSTPPPPGPPTGPHAGLSSNTLHTGYTERMSMSSFVNRTLDPRITIKPKKEEVKQNFKLLIDPFLKKGHTTKITRYDGVLAGQPPVVPKDPRRKKSKIWSIEVCDLPVPEMKLDKNYVGPMPRDTVRFSGLNDNIDRKFLHELCEAYGDIKEYKVYLDPKTNRHTGTGKVVFVEGTPLFKLIASLNGRTVMGKVISVWVEEKQPPGFIMLKEIKTECAKSRTRLIDPLVSSQSMSGHQLLSGQSPHLSTPRTPNISSLQRNHPVAGFNIHDNVYSSQTPPYKAEKQPPPPPPMMSQPMATLSGVTSHLLNQPPLCINTLPPPPPPPSMEYENISPTGNDLKNKNWLKDGKPATPLELTKRQDVDRPNSPYAKMKHIAGSRISYSPVSNSSRSISPISPVVKDVTPTEKKTETFDAISDNESSTMQVEDISPVNTPQLKSRRLSNDDDAMSLSSISSNEDQKVELNIKSKPITHVNNAMNYTPTSVTNNLNRSNVQPNNIQYTQTQFFPQQGPLPMNQCLMPETQRPPGVMNWQQQYPRPSFPPPMFPNNANTRLVPPSNIVTSLNRPPFPMNNNILNPLPQPRQAFNMIQNNTFTVRNPAQMQQVLQLPIQNNNVFPTNNTSDQANQSFVPMVPAIPKDLPFIFQVKAGCARDISLELKRILAKDTLKKLVEQSAFLAFENWWETQRTSKLKSEEESSRVKLEKTDADTNRKLLTDKSSNIVIQTPQSVKDAVSTSVMLQNLFGYDKNNENRPPAANFLNSFRISRKPQAQPIMRASHISRKRPQWPPLSKHKNKLQRLEDSEEEDDDDNNEVDEDQDDFDEEQFEQFARRQRQVRKSGSSLYQKIYSDESDEETDEKSQTEDEDEELEEDKDEVSSSDESSSETSSSETESSETESEEEEQEEESVKKQVVEENKSEIGIDDTPSVSQDDETEEKVLFRSMYDEPRKRKAVQKAEEKIKQSHPKPKPKPQPTRPQRPPRPPRKTQKVKAKKATIVEDSETETAEEEGFSNEDEYADTKESNITIDESVSVTAEEELESKVPTEEELIQNLILLEHNYFSPPPRELQKPKHTEKQLVETVDEVSEEAVKFSMRSKEEENELIWNILYKGIDSEDLGYIKEAFESLQKFGSKELDELNWTEHPVTDLPPYKPKRSKGEAKLRVHGTGCARSEGYYKIPMVEKARYLKSALRKLNILQQRGNHRQQAATEHKIKSRENRAMQRRLASSIAQEEFGSLINYNQTLKMRKKALRFAKSSIHNWGLFTCEPIPADQFVCEYVGQMIRAIVAEVRERRYERSGIGSSYLFRLDMESVIDATKNGCNARFINHSCQPNCYAKVILVEGAKKIVIYSKRDIKLGEEITYDYKFPIEDDKIPCLCGASGCRGSLN